MSCSVDHESIMNDETDCIAQCDDEPLLWCDIAVCDMWHSRRRDFALVPSGSAPSYREIMHCIGNVVPASKGILRAMRWAGYGVQDDARSIARTTNTTSTNSSTHKLLDVTRAGSLGIGGKGTALPIAPGAPRRPRAHRTDRAGVQTMQQRHIFRYA